MLPTHGQGASQAIEDAAALGVLFSAEASEAIASSVEAATNSVQTQLQKFDKLRLPRVRATQTMSNKMMGPIDKMIEEVKGYYVQGRDGDVKVPGPTAKTFSDEFNDFFFRYDVQEEARKVL